MRILVLSLILFAGTTTAAGEEFMRKITWAELKQAGNLQSGEVVASPDLGGPGQALKIENRDKEDKTERVLVLENPGLAKIRYAIQGQVRYENVARGSYLEMWNYFPNGGAYFSRTLDKSGPMQNLSGSSGWRPFVLPFTSNEKTGTPDRLELNVIFTGPGTVYLGPLELVEYEAGEGPTVGSWGQQNAAWVILLILLVLVGIFALNWLLASLGLARRWVMALNGGLFGFGLLGLAAETALLALGEPHAGSYPLLAIGAVVSLVSGLSGPALRRRYEQVELRKMAAIDLGDTVETSH